MRTVAALISLLALAGCAGEGGVPNSEDFPVLGEGVETFEIAVTDIENVVGVPVGYRGWRVKACATFGIFISPPEERPPPRYQGTASATWTGVSNDDALAILSAFEQRFTDLDVPTSRNDFDHGLQVSTNLYETPGVWADGRLGVTYYTEPDFSAEPGDLELGISTPCYTRDELENS